MIYFQFEVLTLFEAVCLFDLPGDESAFYGPNGPDRPDGRFYFSDNAESPLGPLGPSGPFKTLYAGAIPVFFNSVFRF